MICPKRRRELTPEERRARAVVCEKCQKTIRVRPASSGEATVPAHGTNDGQPSLFATGADLAHAMGITKEGA